MRLALVSLHPRLLSGEIDAFVGLGRLLRQRGHSVQATVPFTRTDVLREPLLTIDRGPRSLPAAAVDVLRTIPRAIHAAHDVDVLHLALPTPAFGWVADVVQPRVAAPVLVSYESHLAHARELAHCVAHGGARGYVPLWVINNGLFGRTTAYRGERYVVSSEYQRRELLRLGAPSARVSVIPGVVDTGKLQPEPRPAARRRLGLPVDGPLIGYAGHFNVVKGADTAVAAALELMALGSAAHLALAWTGQGDPAPIMRMLAGFPPGCALHAGKVPIGAFLSAIDVLVLPYRSTAGQSAFPALLMEALHAGCPLVTSDLPLIREAVVPGRTALLCPPDQPRLLAQQIARLLESPELQAGMSAAQVIDARKRFDPQRAARRFEELYRALARKDRPETAAA